MLYNSLHVHTTDGSVGDSILKIKDYVARGKKYGLKALAITDHGSMGAIYTFADECIDNGIKPIIGMEAYEVDDHTITKFTKKEPDVRYHLVLLAKTTEGFHNLLAIHNTAQIEGHYKKFARADMGIFQKYGKGIIALSACIQGRVPRALLNGDKKQAIAFAKTYKECFDEFYLEIQPGQFEEQIEANRALIQLARETDTPIVVTNDVHYLNHEDYVFHDVHVKLGRAHDNKKEVDSENLAYPDTCYWFMDYAALKDAFVYDDIVTEDIVDEAVRNAAVIAESCSIEFDTSMHAPKFPCPEGYTEKEYLAMLCYGRLLEIIDTKKNPAEYVDRLKRELDVIDTKGFCGYFLIVADYVNHAKECKIPVGPGRGSAAGSLVTYLLGICEIDPIQYGLLFERFLDVNKAAFPDIDTDFGGTDNRDSMFRYAAEKYGANFCARVGTLGMRKAKCALRDAARFLHKEELGDAMAKLVPTICYSDDGEKMTDLSIADTLQQVPEFKALADENEELVRLAIGIENLPKSLSEHAAGLVISPLDLTDRIPLVKSSVDGVLGTSLALDDAERSLLKFDFLGVQTLAVIRATENDIGWEYDYHDDSLLNDEEVWNLIGSSNTTGLFQVGTDTYKSRMPRLHPTTIDELAACLALVRGPCIDSGADEVYMDIVNGRRDPEYIHPLYDNITADTNLIMLYQEQIMKLCVAFGYTLPEGYNIMKLAQKKRIEKLKELEPDFLVHAAKHNCDEETARRIFDMIVSAGLYSFNKSHAVAYAYITYVSAYLKVHYPVEFMKNLLTNAYTKGNTKKQTLKAIANDCHRMGIKFLPPDINMSSWEFTVEDGMIRVGMCAVKGFGKKAAEAIQDFTFDNLEELLDNEEVNHTAFNKKAVQIAIFSGMFDFSLGKGENRRTLYEWYWHHQKYDHIRRRNKETGEMEDIEVPVPDEISVSKGFVIDTNHSEGGVKFENQFFDANFKLPKMTKKADYTAA